MSPSTSSALIKRLFGASIAIFFAAVCSSSFASETGCSTTMESVESPSPQASQVVSIDPDTGELVKAVMPDSPTPVQRDTGPVKTRELADGTVIAEVGDRFRTHLIAEMVDGELVTCHRTIDNHSNPVEIKEEQDE